MTAASPRIEPKAIRRTARHTGMHPAAWWLWALMLAAAAARTTAPLLLLLTLLIAGLTVVVHREPGSAGGFGAFLRLGLVVLAIRTVFHLLLGGAGGSHVLFTLPAIRLPAALAGIRLGGPVYAEGMVTMAQDALRLAVLLCCIGAAVALADPRRLLPSLPGALYEVGVAVVVALSMAPELIAVARRVHRARELRGDGAGGRGLLRRTRSWLRIAAPVLAEATDRALALAASMDSRGYGRTTGMSHSRRLTTAALLLTGLLAACFGAFGLLSADGSATLVIAALAIGVIAAGGGLWLGSARVQRTHYRRNSWRAEDLLVFLAGAAALVGSLVSGWLGEPLSPTDPLALPQLPVAAFVGLILSAAPALFGSRAEGSHRLSDGTGGRR